MNKFFTMQTLSNSSARVIHLLAFFILTACVFTPSQALADKKDLDDFGAETIQYEDQIKNSTRPLPLDLVEERDSRKATSKKDVNSNKDDEYHNPTAFLSNINGNDSQALKEITTVLNGSDIELSALIKTFSKLAKRNYIVDGKVKGKVTMHLPTPVSVEEALKVFDTVLLLKGYTTIPVTDNIWKVIPAKDAKQTTIPLYKNSVENPSDVLVTERIRLRHVTSEDGEDLLKGLISKEGSLKAIKGSNSILIIDSQANIARLRELLKEIDVPAVDREITIIPITHAEAGDIAEKINDILGGDENEQQQARNTTRASLRNTRGNSRNRNAQTQQSSERRTLPFKIIPDERTNSLIIVADEEMTLKVQALVDQLDSELDRSSGRFWVYPLKHADAESLAEILNNLISGATEGGSSSGSSTQGSSLTRSTRNTNTNNQNANSNRLTQALARSRRLLAQSRQGTAGAAAGGRVSLEGEVSITSDPATNSVIMNASRSDYLRLKDVIDSLDVKRRQVLVEATILEVTVSDEEGFGVEVQGTAGIETAGGVITQTNFGSITNLLTNPAALTDLTIAAASTGTLTLPGGLTIPSQAVLISAVSAHSNVNILSSPTILATDNEEAEIIVGENVPFVTSTSTDSTNIGNTFNQVERQDVGITLRITPQISSGDYVNLRMFVEISNVVPGTRNDPNGPTTTIRTTETSVEVKNKQMVITGGLIQDSITDATRGVPFIKDIPVIGQLFQRQDVNDNKTNLLVFITPKIISDQFDAREETKALAKSVSKKFDEYGVEPKREEVFKSERLDNVAEEYKGRELPVPSVILPPQTKRPRLHKQTSSSQRNSAPAVSTHNEMIGDLPAAKEKVINVTVSPSLPQASSRQRLNTASQLPRARLAEDTTLESNNTLVVLRKISGSSPDSLAFADEGSTLGVSIPASSNSGNAQFFSPGRKYSQTSNDSVFVCLGVYQNKQQALEAHDAFRTNNSWNRLSTEQMLMLGTQNWLEVAN